MTQNRSRTRIRTATPADLPTLLAIQATSLDSPQPVLLRAGVDGPATVLVAGNVGYALALGHDPSYLAELAVAPGHRGAGHGSALLNAVLARDGNCRLTARADDARVRQFYERHSFRVENRLSDHYGDADGLLMVRQPDSVAASSADRH